MEGTSEEVKRNPKSRRQRNRRRNNANNNDASKNNLEKDTQRSGNNQNSENKGKNSRKRRRKNNKNENNNGDKKKDNSAQTGLEPKNVERITEIRQKSKNSVMVTKLTPTTEKSGNDQKAKQKGSNKATGRKINETKKKEQNETKEVASQQKPTKRRRDRRNRRRRDRKQNNNQKKDTQTNIEKEKENDDKNRTDVQQNQSSNNDENKNKDENEKKKRPNSRNQRNNTNANEVDSPVSKNSERQKKRRRNDRNRNRRNNNNNNNNNNKEQQRRNDNNNNNNNNNVKDNNKNNENFKKQNKNEDYQQKQNQKNQNQQQQNNLNNNLNKKKSEEKKNVKSSSSSNKVENQQFSPLPKNTNQKRKDSEVEEKKENKKPPFSARESRGPRPSKPPMKRSMGFSSNQQKTQNGIGKRGPRKGPLVSLPTPPPIRTDINVDLSLSGPRESYNYRPAEEARTELDYCSQVVDHIHALKKTLQIQNKDKVFLNFLEQRLLTYSQKELVEQEIGFHEENVGKLPQDYQNSSNPHIVLQEKIPLRPPSVPLPAHAKPKDDLDERQARVDREFLNDYRKKPPLSMKKLGTNSHEPSLPPNGPSNRTVDNLGTEQPMGPSNKSEKPNLTMILETRLFGKVPLHIYDGDDVGEVTQSFCRKYAMTDYFDAIYVNVVKRLQSVENRQQFEKHNYHRHGSSPMKYKGNSTSYVD